MSACADGSLRQSAAVWAVLYAALGEAYAVAEGMLENWYQRTPVSQLQYGS
jgi:hypothetical protein